MLHTTKPPETVTPRLAGEQHSPPSCPSGKGLRRSQGIWAAVLWPDPFFEVTG